MSRTFIAGFKAGSSRYELVVDTTSNDTYIMLIDNPVPVYRINAGGWVYSRTDSIVGRFRMMDNLCWYYTSKDESMRINTKFTHLLDAQRDAFSSLLCFGYEE